MAGVMVLCAVVLVGRPTLVRHWDIYASSTGGPRASYPLFLGPFPTAFSCEVEARIIVQSGGHAFCASRLALESGNRHQEQLLAEFWPSARWIALCEARLARRPRPSNAAAASLR